MGLYKKKPVVIQAVRWVGGLIQERPQWLVDAVATGRVIEGRDFFQVSTLGGVMQGNLGDWIIQGICGEIYPCKADIFERTYEPA